MACECARDPMQELLRLQASTKDTVRVNLEDTSSSLYG